MTKFFLPLECERYPCCPNKKTTCQPETRPKNRRRSTVAGLRPESRSDATDCAATAGSVPACSESTLLTPVDRVVVVTKRRTHASRSTSFPILAGFPTFFGFRLFGLTHTTAAARFRGRRRFGFRRHSSKLGIDFFESSSVQVSRKQ